MSIAKYNQIFVDGKWRTYQPYIYSNGMWNKALTNIYTNGAWQEIPEVTWDFWDYAQGGNLNSDIEWGWSRKEIRTGGIDYWSDYEITSNNRIRIYDSNMTAGYHYGNNYSTVNPVYIPETANFLKVTYSIQNTGYNNVNVGLILQDASNAFDISRGGQNYSTKEDGSGDTSAHTISIELSKELKGSRDFIIILNAWTKPGNSGSGGVYFRSVQFTT